MLRQYYHEADHDTPSKSAHCLGITHASDHTADKVDRHRLHGMSRRTALKASQAPRQPALQVGREGIKQILRLQPPRQNKGYSNLHAHTNSCRPTCATKVVDNEATTPQKM